MIKKPKLVNTNKVSKLPREKSTVKAALLRAMNDSQKDVWNKVIILGINKDNEVTLRNTKESDMVLLGLLSIGEAIIHKGIN